MDENQPSPSTDRIFFGFHRSHLTYTSILDSILMKKSNPPTHIITSEGFMEQSLLCNYELLFSPVVLALPMSNGKGRGWVRPPAVGLLDRERVQNLTTADSTWLHVERWAGASKPIDSRRTHKRIEAWFNEPVGAVGSDRPIGPELG